MKKKLYEKPTTKVFELKQHPQLLQSSGDRNPYGDPIPDNWG